MQRLQAVFAENTFTRLFFAFFFAFTVPVSALALYMGHSPHVAGFDLDTPGNRTPVGAVLGAVPDISVFGQSQGVGGTTRVHVTSRSSMGFHTLYVLPDGNTVFAGVPLTETGEAGGSPTDVADSLSSYIRTLQLIESQIRDASPPSP